MNKKVRIFIAGYNNIVGLALKQRLREEGFVNLLIRTQSQLNLMNQKAIQTFFKKEKPEYCFLTSIKEGGIGANIAHSAELIYLNLTAQTNIIHSAWEAKVKRLFFFASSCVYPRACPQPMKEEYILKGPLEPTNEAYSVSKIAGIKMCQAYNRQYKAGFISLIPSNVYGPFDDFSEGASHVVPALVKRFHEAKVKGKRGVIIWGSGRPERDFIFIDDLIDACMFLIEKSELPELINIGTGKGISISRLAELIKKVVDFRRDLRFDASQPDGMPRKILDSNRINSLGWRPTKKLLDGLEETYKWYIQKK